MPGPEMRTFLVPLWILFNKGIRYSTVIDIGCADGHFFLDLFARGLVPGAVPLNIDANALYEDSLRAIKNTLGGYYRISAIADYVGEIELTTSVHPYWTSVRPENDAYWQRVNGLTASKTVVSAATLDSLKNELGIKPPFLLKLDVQGAEVSALRGASAVLKDTSVVICEADIDDFKEINSFLEVNNFVLYDVTCLSYVPDGTLGWFYPVYINRALDRVRPKAFWDAAHNQAVIGVQIERRKSILKSNAEILARIQQSKLK